MDRFALAGDAHAQPLELPTLVSRPSRRSVAPAVGPCRLGVPQRRPHRRRHQPEVREGHRPHRRAGQRPHRRARLRGPPWRPLRPRWLLRRRPPRPRLLRPRLPRLATPPAATAAPASAAGCSRVAPSLTRRYWLVTEQTVPGMAEYDIDSYVNSKWIRKLRNNEEQVVTDITRHLQPGKNTRCCSSRRRWRRRTPKSNSPRARVPGHHRRGQRGGANVMIDNPLIRFQRNAAEARTSPRSSPLPHGSARGGSWSVFTYRRALPRACPRAASRSSRCTRPSTRRTWPSPASRRGRRRPSSWACAAGGLRVFVYLYLAEAAGLRGVRLRPAQHRPPRSTRARRPTRWPSWSPWAS